MGGPAGTAARSAAGRLSVADLCDVAYVLVIEGFERDHAADNVAAGVTRALGGDAEVAPLTDRIDEFDEWLLTPVAAGGAEIDEWSRAMGVA